jgi:hypothetical protein
MPTEPEMEQRVFALYKNKLIEGSSEKVSRTEHYFE